MTGLRSGDLAILALGAGSALAVGALGAVTVRAARRRSLRVSLLAVPIATLAAVAAAVAVAASVMFLSAHDLRVVVLTLAAAAPVSAGLAIWLGQGLSRTGRSLADAARELGAGATPAPRAPLVGAELVTAYDELVASGHRLEQARQRERALESSRRELVAWVSHDLRTPLAGIRAMAEALEDGVAEDPAQYYKQLQVESDRLASMVDSLFLLSRIHAGALQPGSERVAVRDVVSDAIASVRPLAAARSVRLDGDADPAAIVAVDAAQLSRAVANLLTNAIRHTRERGQVRVAAHRRGADVVLSVIDECGGIPDEDLPRLFDLGWRGDGARASRPDGRAGLGLAVTRGIIAAHGGSVAVVNVPGGCRFDATLPAAR